MATALFIVCAVSYLVGSVPTGLVLAKLTAGPDVRTRGSGNIGATNVTRVLGKKLGAATFVGDTAKGFIPVFAGLQLFQGSLEPFQVAYAASAFGMAAFLGHLFPVFLKFRGGKGVATACGVFLGLAPAAMPAVIALFVIVVLLSRYVSLGSLSAAVSLPFLLIGSAALGKQYPYPVIVLSILIAVLIILKHTANIQLLLSGDEHKVGTGSATRHISGRQ